MNSNLGGNIALMTLFEFKLLAEDEQIEVIWESGHFVADRYEHDCSVLLYQVDSFYVEVFYVVWLNRFEILRSFTNTEQLSPYLDEIDISSLIN
jgi:hypothetical protein